MSDDARRLLELLAKLNQLETRCKRFPAPQAVPPVVYEYLDKLRAEISRWGVECFADKDDQ